MKKTLIIFFIFFINFLTIFSRTWENNEGWSCGAYASVISKDYEIGSIIGIEIEKQIADNFIFSIIGEKLIDYDDIGANAEFDIKTRIYKNLFFNIGMGIGYKQTDKCIDHGFHTTNAALEYRKKLTTHSMLLIRPKWMYKEDTVWIRPSFERSVFNLTIGYLYNF